VTSRHPAPSTDALHPAPETLAALIDGRLPADQRVALTEHLASCDPCRELFAEAARWVHDGDGQAADRDRVLRPPASHWKRRLAVGGTLLAAAAAGAFLVWTPAGDRGLETVLPVHLLVDAVGLDPDDAAHVLGSAEDRGWPVLLGPAYEPALTPESSFRLGVRVFDLEAVLAVGDRSQAERITYEIESILEAEPHLGAVAALFGEPEGLRAQLAAGMPLHELRERSREADELLGPDPADGGPGFADPFWFAFGKWAAAGELAASAGRSEFFDTRWHESFLDRLSSAGLSPETEAAAREVEGALGLLSGDGDLRRLERAFEELIAVAGGGEPSPYPS